MGFLPDVIICNNQQFPPYLLAKYEEEHSYPVSIDYDELAHLDIFVIEAPLIGETLARHDSKKLAALLYKLVSSTVQKKKAGLSHFSDKSKEP